MVTGAKNSVPAKPVYPPTIAEIKKAVMQSYGVSETDLELTKRGQINEPRNLAIFLSRKLSGLRLEDICKEFSLGSYSSVSSVVIRTEHLLSRNKQLLKKADKIKQMLSKSQAKT